MADEAKPDKEKADEGTPSPAFLRAALRQNWEHARFEETQRLTFATVYAAIVAGFLFYASGRSITDTGPLLLLLFVLSIVGLMMTMKWNIVFDAHLRAIDRIVSLDTVKLRKYVVTGFPPKELRASRFVRLVRVGYVFDFFYIFLGWGWFYYSEPWISSIWSSWPSSPTAEEALALLVFLVLVLLMLWHERESNKVMDQM